MPLPRVPRSLWLLAALPLLAAGCGDDADSASAAIASLESADDTAAVDDAPVDLSAEDAALAFSECLRAEGIDVPDIGVDADGNLDLGASFQDLGVELGGEEFRSAQETCSPLLEGIAFGGRGDRAGLGDNPELEDAFLDYSACIRAEGFDVGDLSLGQPGGGAGGEPPTGLADGEGPVRGQGQRQGGFGDPTTRFAEQLGLDADDPEVAAALEVCAPIIEDAFAATGVGPGGDE